MPVESAAAKIPAQTMRLTVLPEHAGLRLDRFLASQLPEMSRTRIQSLVEQGRVVVDGLVRKASHRIEPGATVAIEIPPPPLPGAQPEQIPLDILYEDEDIVAVNKPAGMIVHPGAGAEKGTLVAALLHHFGGAGGLSTIGAPLRPGIVHRLDKRTSGVVVVARTDAAHLNLAEQFRSRRVEKTYLALLHGKVKGESGRIQLPVARDLRRRSRMTARRREGREARTDWRVRLRLNGFSLIEADLHTGRTHQIRVHFSALGSPVVGDTLYGAPRQERVHSELLSTLGRNFLHAARIGFTHPRTGKPVEIRAPLPEDLRGYLEVLGRAAQTDSRAIDAALRGFL
ncbi:MAG TPA: RluA family pseudouridine synthase [Candidatus Limnocylindrales bacterium]|jgi:23S rRNA pseudouridine1911/1915/1917 synthase|nr:RluA family pseudouridine synthase [Candidatus Limnocylindrales bacterium]